MNPDSVYIKTGYDLTSYEDTELNSLLRNLPDYYTQTDQTLYGQLLRIISKELARVEYAFTYDLVSGSVINLNPADLLRVFRDALALTSRIPQSGQYDLDLKTMILKIVAAMREGSRLSSIQAIVEAFAGDTVLVSELFRSIGDGVYDISDRNTVSVSAKVSQNGVSMMDVQVFTEDLYPVLDLVKPAHVGVALKAVFGLDESVAPLIEGIQDSLRLSAVFIEDSPLPTPFYLSPDQESTPLSSLAPNAQFFTKGNVTLVGLGPQDKGIWSSLSDGALVKVAYQTNGNENGFYKAHAGTWERFIPNQGVLSPILDTVWEVSEGTMEIMDLG